MRILGRGNINPPVSGSKKESQEVEDWRAVFKLARRKRQAQENNWIRWAFIMDDNLWRGGKLPDSTEPLEVNEMKSNILTILPALILEPPVIDVKTFDPYLVDHAFIWERVAEYIDRFYDIFEELMYTSYDALLYGNGIIKVGYWPDAMIGNQTWGVGFSRDRASAYAKNASLFEIFPDYRVRRWSEQRFIIQETPMHIDDVRNSDMYNKRVTNKLEPNLSADRVYEFELNVGGLKNEYISVQEIQDFTTGEMKVMAEGANRWLYNDEMPHIDIRSPFENLEFFPRPRVIWGDSISQTIERHCKSLSEVFTYMDREAAKAGIKKMIFNPNAWDEDAIKEMKKNSDSYIHVEADPSLEGSYHVVDFGTSRGMYAWDRAISAYQEIIRSSTGVTQQELGRHEEGVETLGEVQVLKMASGIKNSMRQKRFSRFAARVISKLLYIVSTTYPRERILEMAGMSPDDPRGYTLGVFDPTKFVVEYGGTAMNSRIERWNKLQAFFGLFGQYLNPAVAVRMGTEILDFDYADELLVYNAAGMGAGQRGARTSSVLQAAMPVARSRLAEPGVGEGF